MPENHDIKGIIRHVAEIIIEELKLEDVTVGYIQSGYGSGG